MLPNHKSSSSVRRRWKAVVVSLFLLALSFIRIRDGQQVWKMAGVPSILSPQVTQVQKQQHSSNDDSCKTLLLHEGGHWEHHYYHQQQSLNNNTTKELYTSIFNNTTRHYFPQEMDWILSNNSWPDKSWGTCFHLHVSDTQYMYQSKLGNQCGSCGVVVGILNTSC